MHDTITIGIPVLAILFGVLWNNQGLRDLKTELKSEIKDLRGEMKNDFLRIESKQDRMQADLSQFYRILGEHGARIDNIEKR